MTSTPGEVSHSPSDATAKQLQDLVDEAHRTGQLPDVAAATFTAGRVDWQTQLGQTGPTQYRIGSISKTFTAVLVLRLRDEGLLSLDDPVGKHLPDAPYGDHSIRQLLSHSAGITAEPAGPWWERTPGVSWPELAQANRDAPQLFAPGQRMHYSNLGFGLLGELVARLRGGSWFDAVETELLGVLGMTQTSYGPGPDAATGTSRNPHSGRLVGEPAHDARAMAAAGQLWSTVADLVRWGDFLVSGHQDVLAVSTLREMSTVMSADPDSQHLEAYGLGLQLYWHPAGTLVGHMGSMPGFLAGLLVHPPTRIGAVVLTNATRGLGPDTVVVKLIQARLDERSSSSDTLPGDSETTPPADPSAVELEGDWYWGNTPMRLTPSRNGFSLTSTAATRRFARRGPDRFVGLDDYFAGEELMVHRKADGTLWYLEVVTFVLTREPYDASAPIPGGPPLELA